MNQLIAQDTLIHKNVNTGEVSFSLAFPSGLGREVVLMVKPFLLVMAP